MINSYKEKQAKYAKDKELVDLLHKMKNKKVKLKKIKKLSLTECLEKRKLIYPDNRKWVGNFNELLY